MAPILEVRNVTKRFPGVLANDRVSFSLKQGEILAFLGENGAGKSTLMNILYGLYTQDEGEIEVRGKPVEIARSQRCHRTGHRHGPPALSTGPGLYRGREHCDGHRADPLLLLLADAGIGRAGWRPCSFSLAASLPWTAWGNGCWLRSLAARPWRPSMAWSSCWAS